MFKGKCKVGACEAYGICCSYPCSKCMGVSSKKAGAQRVNSRDLQEVPLEFSVEQHKHRRKLPEVEGTLTKKDEREQSQVGIQGQE